MHTLQSYSAAETMHDNTCANPLLAGAIAATPYMELVHAPTIRVSPLSHSRGTEPQDESKQHKLRLRMQLGPGGRPHASPCRTAAALPVRNNAFLYTYLITPLPPPPRVLAHGTPFAAAAHTAMLAVKRHTMRPCKNIYTQRVNDVQQCWNVE